MKKPLKNISLFFSFVGLACILSVLIIRFAIASMAPPAIMEQSFYAGFLSIITAFLLSIINIIKNKKEANGYDYWTIIIPLILCIVMFLIFMIVPNTYPYE